MWISDTKVDDVVQEVWGNAIFSLRGCSSSYLQLCFWYTGQVSPEVINTSSFSLLTNPNGSERSQRSVVKRERYLESELLCALLLLDYVTLG